MPLNENVLKALSAMAGKRIPRFLANTLDRFIRDVTILIGSMKTMLVSNELHMLETPASDLQSKCSIVGAKQMAILAQKVVQLSKSGAQNDTKLAVTELEHEFNRIRLFLKGSMDKLTTQRPNAGPMGHPR